MDDDLADSPNERTLFDAVAGFATAREVAAYLSEILPHQSAADLKQRVIALYTSHQESEGWLDAGEIPHSPTATGFVGERLGNYRLLRILGQGGFGVVWLAEQERPMKRLVALKILKAGLDTEAVVARFEQERQALAMMDHPNVAKIYDAGSTPQGRPFLAMEYLDGDPLMEYAAKHSLSVQKRVELSLQVVAALHHAHQRGVIHRDLKPSNVLVVEVDGRPQAKVIDFGVAKMIATDGNEGLTMAGQYWGTPDYMSPEQRHGKAIDVRSDVYAFGLLLYELLTGLRAVTSAQKDHETSLTPPSRAYTRSQKLIGAQPADFPSFAGQLKGELDWIVLKAAAFEPSERYESAAALRDDLERYLTGRAVVAGPPSGWYRASKFIRRNKGKLATAAMIIGLLVASSIVSLSMAKRASEAANHLRAALFHSHLTEARALRQTSRPGQRLLAQQAIQNAAAIKTTDELRNEALATMCLPDLEVLQTLDRGDTKGRLIEYDYESDVLISGSEGGPATIYRQFSQRQQPERVPLPEGVTGVYKISLRPGGKELLVYPSPPPSPDTIGLGHPLLLIDLQSGESRKLTVAADYYAHRASFFDGGRQLMIPLISNEVAIMNPDTGEETKRMPLPGKLEGLALDDAHRRMMLIHGQVSVMNYEQQSAPVSLKGFRSCSAGTIFADGSLAALGREDGQVVFFDLVALMQGEPSHSYRKPIHAQKVDHLESVLGGDWILSSGWDTKICLSNASGTSSLTLDGNLISAAAKGDRALILQGQRISLVQLIGSTECHSASVFGISTHRTVTFSSQSKQMVVTASGMDDHLGGSMLYELPEFRLAARLGSNHRNAKFDPNGTRLFTAAKGLGLWPLDHLGRTADYQRMVRPVAELKPADKACVVDVSPDGARLAVAFCGGGSDETLVTSLYDIRSSPTNPILIKDIPWGHKALAVDSLAFDPKGQWLAIAYWKGSGVDIYNAVDGNWLTTLQPDVVSAKLAVHPEGHFLATCSANSLTIFETQSWQPTQQIQVPPSTDFAHSVAWHPNGREIAYEGETGEVIIARTSDGVRLSRLTLPLRLRLSSLGYSPDGRYLAVSVPGQTVVYDFQAVASSLRKMGLEFWQ